MKLTNYESTKAIALERVRGAHSLDMFFERSIGQSLPGYVDSKTTSAPFVKTEGKGSGVEDVCAVLDVVIDEAATANGDSDVCRRSACT